MRIREICAFRESCNATSAQQVFILDLVCCKCSVMTVALPLGVRDISSLFGHPDTLVDGSIVFIACIGETK